MIKLIRVENHITRKYHWWLLFIFFWRSIWIR